MNIAPTSAPSAFVEVGSSRDAEQREDPAPSPAADGRGAPRQQRGRSAGARPRRVRLLASSTFIDYTDRFPVTWRNLPARSRPAWPYLAPLSVGELDCRLPPHARHLLVPARCLGHRAGEQAARGRAPEACAGRPAAGPAHRRLRLRRRPAARHHARQPGLHARALAHASRRRGDAAQRLPGQCRAWRRGLQHRPQLGARAEGARPDRRRRSAARARPRCWVTASSARCATPPTSSARSTSSTSACAIRCAPPARQLRQQPTEKIAARDVVDGLALLDAWRTGPKADVLAIVGNGDRPIIAGVLDDSDADLGRGQRRDGGRERLPAGAEQPRALGRRRRDARRACEPDCSPQVTQTPRSGVSYAQRAGRAVQRRLRLPRLEAAAAETRAAPSSRGSTPGCARMLGDPTRFAFKALKMRDDALDGDVLAHAGRAAARPAVAGAGRRRAAGRTAARRATPLRRWLVAAFERAVPAEPGLTLDILIDERHRRRRAAGAGRVRSRGGNGARPHRRRATAHPEGRGGAEGRDRGTSPNPGEQPGVDLADTRLTQSPR